KVLIDYVLDRLAAQGIEHAVVNVHHLADQIERHLAGRKRPKIVISDERRELLGTAGGVFKALPKLGDGPFFHVNSDTIWIDGVKPNLARLADAFDPERMDALLLLATTASSIGYSGHGDFSMAADGRLTRRGEREVVPFVYAGAANQSLESADDPRPPRLHHPGVDAVRADADPRARRRNAGAGLSRYARSARARARHPLPADATRLPAGARSLPRRHQGARGDPAAHHRHRRRRRGRDRLCGGGNRRARRRRARL